VIGATVAVGGKGVEVRVGVVEGNGVGVVLGVTVKVAVGVALPKVMGMGVSWVAQPPVSSRNRLNPMVNFRRLFIPSLQIWFPRSASEASFPRQVIPVEPGKPLTTT
jgi:hypothetical protein